MSKPHKAVKAVNPHASALGKLGAVQGGKARWVGVSDEERTRIAKANGKRGGDANARRLAAERAAKKKVPEGY